MAGRNSQDQEGITWQTAALPLGSRGLDLRNTAEPGALSKLTNARFIDPRTAVRRDGHEGVKLQDGSDFPNTSDIVAGDWVYGFGRLIVDDPLNPMATPQPRQALGVFDFNDTTVAWTGDRLLGVRRDGSTCIGASSHWDRSTSTPQPKGIPAFLPVQTDDFPPETLTGDYLETCLTPTLRVIVQTNDANQLVGWIIDRATGMVINRSVISIGNSIRGPRVINSNGFPVVVWRDNEVLYRSYWTGAWTPPDPFAAGCDAFDVAPTADGFFVVWRTDETGASVLKIGRFVGYITDDTPIQFGSAVNNPNVTTGPLALTVSDVGFAIAFENALDHSLWMGFSNWTGDFNGAQIGPAGPWDSGLTICFRQLPSTVGWPNAVIHAGQAGYTKIYEVFGFSEGSLPEVVAEETRYHTKVLSKSFRVGDEVFCWLRATNSSTGYLVGGVKMPQVSGICDREDAHSRVVHDGTLAIPMVSRDPLDAHKLTWIRPYVTQRVVTIDDTKTRWEQIYARPGNARIGDMDFLPALSAAQYGRGVYLAGSHVRVWDGIELGDAGFHDYPTVESSENPTPHDGDLTPNKTYRIRVYAVRYSRLGERYQSGAIPASASLISSENKIIWTINTVPCTNHDDVVLEVYRTEGDGTTYYLEGVVANDLGAATVEFTSSISDEDLRKQQGDPHAPSVGIPSEIEEFGPTGCAFLAVGADRLWAAGGQIPRGWVHFSKLKEQNEGAGFDAIAGYQEVDSEGGAVTSIINWGNGVVIFERDRLYVMAGGGPDNYGNGSFSTPELVLADGANTHLGTGVTQEGVVFWGEGGPRLLDQSLRVQDIHLPIQSLALELEPTGIRVDLRLHEVVWYTANGGALLWNYQSGSRWARWTGLKVAGVSRNALVRPDGVVLFEDPSARGDYGAPYAFAGATTDMNPEQILGGSALLRAIGIVGEHKGPHNLRLRVFYNQMPLWTDQWIWEPETNTLLLSVEDADSTPADLDAMGLTDHTGGYATHKRTSRNECRTFRVEWSDIGSDGPTYTPLELTLEMGVRPGLGRVPVATFRS